MQADVGWHLFRQGRPFPSKARKCPDRILGRVGDGSNPPRLPINVDISCLQVDFSDGCFSLCGKLGQVVFLIAFM